MTRSRASAKAAGSSWEKDICEYLISEGWRDTERRRLEGKNDRGDIAGIYDVCIEAKNVSAISLATILDETEVEGKNANASVAAAWIKRRGRSSPAAAYVVMSGERFAALLKKAGY